MLTDDKIDAIWTRRAGPRGSILKPQLRQFARAIIAAIEKDALPVVPAGWKLVEVNEHFDSLVRALARADVKGYLPDAMRDEWAAFDYNYLAAPLAEKDGAQVGDGWKLLTNEEVFDLWDEAYTDVPSPDRPALTSIPWLEIQAAVFKKNQLPAAPGAATPAPEVVVVPMLTQTEIVHACAGSYRSDQYPEIVQRATIAKANAALSAAGKAVRLEVK